MMIAKSKNRSQQGLTLSFLWQQEFEFVSPLRVDECADLLVAKSERGGGMFANRRKLLVEINGFRGDHFNFRMHRRYGKNSSIEVKGSLRRWDENSTMVSGYAMSDRFGLLFSLLLTPVFLFILISIWENLLPILFLVMILAFSVGYMIVLRQQMIKIVYDTLSDQIY